MPVVLDEALRQALAARLRYYRELGISEFYQQDVPVEEPLAAVLQAEPFVAATPPEIVIEPSTVAAPAFSPISVSPVPIPPEEFAIPPRKPFPAPPPVAAPVAAADHASALQIIRNEIGDCTRCSLAQGRNKLVFGDGDPNARLMFVGEGPGADEDAQGLPFVGRGGQLLNNMIGAMGLQRSQVYIANVVKCRPPANRQPEPDEAHTCMPFLFKQIDVVRPEVLVALGQTAVTYLTGERKPLAAWRGRIHQLRSSKLIVTYHPAFLLRDPRQKKEAWKDLQIAMAELGLERSPSEQQ